MVKRSINNIELEINEKEANEIYLPKIFVDSIIKFDGELETIKREIYKWDGNENYFPLSIFWELTNKCNFSCPFCYINTPKAKEYKPIDFEECKIIIDELIKLGMLFCTFSGGECLLYKNFKKIYKYAKEHGAIVTVFTNGYLIDDEIIELFKAYKPYKVEISIYGLTNDIFRQATNSQYDSKTVLGNILRLKNLGIWVRCKTPITKFTSKEILNIKEWCQKHDIDYYVSDELLPTYEGEAVDEYKIFDNVYEQAVNNKVIFLRKRRNKKFGYKIAWDCSAGKYSGVIAADHFFHPCMLSIGIEKYAFPMKNGIESAINEFRKVLAEEKGKKLPFCNGCEWCDICEKCVLSLANGATNKNAHDCKEIRKI